MKNILIFGGTFDPVHSGHELFLRCAQELCCPELTLIIPCSVPPHKQSAKATDEMRVKMCEILCEGRKNTVVDKQEILRGGKSFTIDTVKAVINKYPGAKLYMCVGGDMLLYFRKWRAWQELISLVTLVVQPRENNIAQIRAEAISLSQSGANILFTQTQPLVVSSTELRERLCNGEDVKALVPKKIDEIITQYNLYKR